MEIDEKRLKEILDEQRKESQRFIGVLVENFQSGLNAIGEQYADIKKTLNSHTEILDSHTEMIGSMKMDIEIIKSNVEFMKNSLKKKVDVEEFEALEKRVRFLEAKIAA